MHAVWFLQACFVLDQCSLSNIVLKRFAIKGITVCLKKAQRCVWSSKCNRGGPEIGSLQDVWRKNRRIAFSPHPKGEYVAKLDYSRWEKRIVKFSKSHTKLVSPCFLTFILWFHALIECSRFHLKDYNCVCRWQFCFCVLKFWCYYAHNVISRLPTFNAITKNIPASSGSGLPTG